MAATYERTKLTKPVVEGAQPAFVDGKPRQKIIFDTEVAGFGLLVGAKSKAFFAQQSISGKVVRVTIGRFPVFTADSARREARKLIGQMSDGKNPTEEKRKKRAQAITFAEAWQLTQDTLRAKGRSPKTMHRYGHTINLYLKSWLKKELAVITREDVRLKHKQIAGDVAKGKYAAGRTRTEDHGFSAANDAMRVFRAIWNRARRQHPELPECPTANVDWFRTAPPRSALSPETLRTWYQAVMADKNTVRRDNLLLMLFTGLRRTSAAEVRWEDVDFERRSLRIPCPKGGESKAFDLPLPNFLLELFSERWIENAGFAPGSDWVFPAESASGHIVEQRLDVPGVKWTPHDLRRTFITVANSIAISHYDLKSLVNHSQPSGDTTAGYITVHFEQLRAPMQAITDRLMAICEGPGAGAEVVVPIRGYKLSL